MEWHGAAQALPPSLQAVVDRLVAAGVYGACEAPNHCLVNEYRGGAGIPPHDDGPLYLDKVCDAACGARRLPISALLLRRSRRKFV
jgi:hypothetical protein